MATVVTIEYVGKEVDETVELAIEVFDAKIRRAQRIALNAQKRNRVGGKRRKGWHKVNRQASCRRVW